jgi:hypothetical protein
LYVILLWVLVDPCDKHKVRYLYALQLIKRHLSHTCLPTQRICCERKPPISDTIHEGFHMPNELPPLPTTRSQFEPIQSMEVCLTCHFLYFNALFAYRCVKLQVPPISSPNPEQWSNGHAAGATLMDNYSAVNNSNFFPSTRYPGNLGQDDLGPWGNQTHHGSQPALGIPPCIPIPPTLPQFEYHAPVAPVRVPSRSPPSSDAHMARLVDLYIADALRRSPQSSASSTTCCRALFRKS